MPNSRIINSNQTSIHNKLDSVVRRHLATRFRRPFPDFSLQAFERAKTLVDAHHGPLIFDSFCGVGESTLNLAKQFPQALVLGIDKSSHRLNKHEQYVSAQTGRQKPANYYLLQADVDDFWRLAVDAGWQLARHYLLYPNPWPKASQLKRRVHGSPLFPALLALGGSIELRSNWPLYVEEFSTALTIAGQRPEQNQFIAKPAITPFERKYSASGQSLYRCNCQLSKPCL